MSKITVMSNHIKREIDTNEILYIKTQNRKSAFYLKNKMIIETYVPIKDIKLKLPENEFVVANKGLIIAKSTIVNFEDNMFVLADGTKLKGRSRTKGDNVRLINEYRSKLNIDDHIDFNSYSIVDKMPVAFCVIELVFDCNGHGMDFIFRYCNKAMEDLEGIPIDKMINQSFYNVFKDADKKWILIYSDVAINGGKKVVNEYSPEICKHLEIHCFQPKRGYCACLLMDKDEKQ